MYDLPESKRDRVLPGETTYFWGRRPTSGGDDLLPGETKMQGVGAVVAGSAREMAGPGD